MNIVCVVVDRLRVAALGPYGQSGLDTEEFNRLAGRSFVADQAYADASPLDLIYRGYWFGRLAAEPLALVTAPADPEAPPQPSLARLLSDAGAATHLLTDDAGVTKFAGADDFASIDLVAASTAAEPADDVAETELFSLFAEAASWIENAPERFCMWVHARGMGGLWDAPIEYRQRLRDEEDPEAYLGMEPPRVHFPRDPDPDELLPFRQAYLAQVAVLDACLGPLMDTIQAAAQRAPLLFALVGSRGMPLGEHRWLGAWDECLYEEQLHVPLFLHFSDGAGAAARSQSLRVPADLAATFAEAAGIAWQGPQEGRSLMPEAAAPTPPPRDRFLTASHPAGRVFRTPAWQLHLPADDASPQLFVKPDDRWEMNDVAPRLSDVAQRMGQATAAYDAALTAGASPPPLDEDLIESTLH